MKPLNIFLFIFAWLITSISMAGIPQFCANSIGNNSGMNPDKYNTSNYSEIYELNVNIGWNHPCGNSLEISRRLKFNKIAFGIGESLNGIRLALIYSRFFSENGFVKPIIGIGLGIVPGKGIILQEADKYNRTKLVQTGFTITPRFSLRFDDLGSPFDLSVGYVFAPRWFKGNFFDRTKEISYPLEGIEISFTTVFQFI